MIIEEPLKGSVDGLLVQKVSQIIHPFLREQRPRGTYRPELYCLGCQENFFFRARFTSFHTHSSPHTFFFYFFVSFHTCCSHARVFWKITLHEIHTSYSNAELYVFFSERVTTIKCTICGRHNDAFVNLYFSKLTMLIEELIKYISNDFFIRYFSKIKNITTNTVYYNSVLFNSTPQPKQSRFPEGEGSKFHSVQLQKKWNSSTSVFHTCTCSYLFIHTCTPSL